MSDAQKTVDLIFNGVDRTGLAVESVLSNTNRLSGSIQGATQPFADAAAAAVKYEAALLATGAAITAFSIKAAGDFDGGFREIATLIDEPIEALDEFREAILGYGASSSSSLADVNAAVYAAISAGVDYTDSLGVVREAEQLAVAGKGDLQSTLTLLVSSLNAYGLETDQAARFSDALFTAVREGQTTLPELNESLQAVTTTAATLGVPFEEVLAALSALTASGTPTAQAVTQINAVLAAMLKPSAEAASTAADLGVEFGAQAIKANGLQATLQAVYEATGGNEEVMAKLFPRVEALRAVFPLTGIAAEKFSDSLEAQANKAGATEAAYQKMANGLEQVSGRLSSSFEVLGVAIGGPLLDEVGSVADAIGEVLNALAQSFTSGELSGITAFIEQEFGNLANVLAGVAQALPQALSQTDLSGFIDGLEAVRDAVTSLFGGLDLTDADDLARAIEFVGNAFEGLSQFSAGVIESFGPLLQYFAQLAEEATKGGDALRGLGQVFGIASQINTFAGALGGATQAVEALVWILVAKQGGSLVYGLKTLATTMAGGGGLLALLGQAGLVGAAGAAGAAIGTLANKTAEFATGQSLSSRLADWALGFNDSYQAAQLLIKSTDDLRPSAEASAAAIAAADAEMVKLAQSSGNVAIESGKVITAANDLEAAWAPYPDLIYDAAEATEKLGSDGANLTGYFSVVSSGVSTAASALDDLKEASAETRAELAIAAVEAQGAIRVAEIEADAERAVAAFEAIASSVQSTGDVLGDLYDALGDENISKFDKLDIKDTIEAEAESRNKLIQTQIDQANAEIRLANARTRALNRGDAMIKISGDGLQPHLEAFMFEIIEAIQVRVNADGYNLLLGAT